MPINEEQLRSVNIAQVRYHKQALWKRSLLDKSLSCFR